MSDSSGTRSGGRPAPTSLAQQAALLPERMRRTAVPNLFVALEISPALDAVALDRAAVELVSRHEILRTVYPDDRRIPYQKVAPAPDSVVEIVESEDTETTADADHRFDLVHDSPVRIRLHRSPDRDVLSIAVHPVAADDRSVELLVAELFATYAGATVPAPAQYRTFATAELKTLASNASGDADLNYWLQRLAELPERADIAAAEPAPGAASRYTFRVPPEAIASAGAGTPAEAVSAAVVTHALSETGMADDVAVGLTDPGRAADGAETALGGFANQLVLRLDPTGDRTPRQLIEDAARATAEARAHAGTRIERLTHEMRGAAAVTSGVPFQVLVNVRAEAATAPVAGHTVRELTRRIARPYGVDILVDVVTGDGADVTVDVTPALAGHPELDEFVRLLERKYSEWAARPDDPARRREDGPALFTRTTLPPPGTTGLGGAPRSDEERMLADAIRQVLDLDEDDEVGRADTFFSLGGDSIAALRLATLLGEQGYALEVQTVFEFPAIHELAEQLVPADPEAAATDTAAPTVAPMGASGLDQDALQALGRKFAAQ
ncbi:condensation domain-containing protein [Nocardia sp. BMG51109]|uniref:condensation domain-containing protein n=1 Tax=Nocardia sp. BMG51109 TaxID=1056816 RepID=UPI000463829B|nr:condensation domain-containing protein [Nocardia sp. BMG51109]